GELENARILRPLRHDAFPGLAGAYRCGDDRQVRDPAAAGHLLAHAPRRLPSAQRQRPREIGERRIVPTRLAVAEQEQLPHLKTAQGVKRANASRSTSSRSAAGDLMAWSPFSTIL